MATQSFHYHQCQHHHHHHRHHQSKRHTPSLDCPPPSTTLFLKATKSTTTTTKITTIKSTTTFSISPTASITSSSSSCSPSLASTSQDDISYDLLRDHLSSRDFRQADEETRRLLIALAGEPARKRGYVFFSEVQFISEADLRAIDSLWRQHSDGRFGYSVQKKVWEKANRDFTGFFIRVRWMRKLDTEVEQYNYRSFPGEFMWELTDDTPVGHLPLTNALRGTQLLNSILTHPAFREVEEEEEKGEGEGASGDEGQGSGVLKGVKDGSKALKNRVFKPDYSL